MFPQRSGFNDPPPDDFDQIGIALDKKLRQREARIQELRQHGRPFTMPVQLQITAVAGAQTSPQSAALESDFLITWIESTLYKSSIEIQAGNTRPLTNGPTPLSAIFNCLTTGGNFIEHVNWDWNYLLLAKAVLRFTTTADGTETGGVITLIGLIDPFDN